jgi:hypothetical protein
MDKELRGIITGFRGRFKTRVDIINATIENPDVRQHMAKAAVVKAAKSIDAPSQTSNRFRDAVEVLAGLEMTTGVVSSDEEWGNATYIVGRVSDEFRDFGIGDTWGQPMTVPDFFWDYGVKHYLQLAGVVTGSVPVLDKPADRLEALAIARSLALRFVIAVAVETTKTASEDGSLKQRTNEPAVWFGSRLLTWSGRGGMDL